MKATHPAVTMWNFALSRDYGGDKWKWPRLEAWKREGVRTIRIGWRMTAWGLHASRNDLSRAEANRVIAAAATRGVS